MAITLDGTTGVTAAEFDGALDASNLTGALPAIDGSALTGISSGGMTLLGSVATTSGNSATLSGLDLTSYKCLLIVGKAISFTATNQYVALGPDNGTGFWPQNQSIAYLTSSDTYVVSFMTWVDIINDVFGSSGNMASINPTNGGVASITNQAVANYGHGYTQASTSITLSSDGTFDAGNVYIYGVA